MKLQILGGLGSLVNAFLHPCSAKIPSQLISLDLRMPGTPCCRHADLAFNRGRTSSQFGRLCVVPSDSSVAHPGAPSATRRLQAQIQETLAKKQGSTLLALAVKDLETLEIGIDSREPGDRGPMAKKKISRVLVENVSPRAGQTCNSR